jgi:hypothetical protein
MEKARLRQKIKKIKERQEEKNANKKKTRQPISKAKQRKTQGKVNA